MLLPEADDEKLSLAYHFSLALKTMSSELDRQLLSVSNSYYFTIISNRTKQELKNELKEKERRNGSDMK